MCAFAVRINHSIMESMASDILLDESFRLIEGCVSDTLKMCQATFLDGENYVFSGRFIS